MWTTPLILLLLSFFGMSSAFDPDDPEFTSHFFNGNMPPRNHFHGFVAQDNNRDIVEKFLTRVTRSIESKDLSIIGGLFQPGFIFKGCKGTYNKQQIIGMISQIPAGTKFSFVLNTVEDLGDFIKYTVSVSGFGPSQLEAEFKLNKIDQQLHCGRIPACQKTHFYGFVAHDNIGNIPPRSSHFDGHPFIGAQPENPNSIMSNFVEQMKQVIAHRNPTELGKLFDDNFVFQDCPEVYHKADVIKKFAEIPGFITVGIDLKKAEWNNQGQIIFTVTISVFTLPDTDYEFVFCPYRNVLKAGRRIKCDPKRSGEHIPHFLIGRSSAPREDSDVVIGKFLDAMKPIIASRDSKSIGNLFDDNFIFKGCQGTYTKDDSVKKITSIPPEYILEIQFKSSKYNSQGQIEYIVSVSIPSKGPIDAQFVYCPFKNVLKSGRIPSCPARRFADFY